MKKSLFSKFANKITQAAGSSVAFILATASILVWAIVGPHFHYSDAWQLVINTFTTLSTFLMVFLIQHTQNKESKMIHIKLDDIIKALSKTDKTLIDLEEIDNTELEHLHDIIKEQLRNLQDKE